MKNKEKEKDLNILKNYCFKYTCKRCPRKVTCDKEIEKKRGNNK